MKNYLVLPTVLIFFQFYCFGQNVFLDLEGGYSFPLASQNITYSSNYTNTGANISYDSEQINGSFGQGPNFGFGINVMINENIGFKVQGNYLISKKFTGENNSTFTMNGELISNSMGISEYSAKMLRIIPSVVYMLPGERFSLYTNLGLVFGVGRVDYREEMSSTDNGNQTMEMVFNGGMALGASAEIGLNYYLTEKISLMGGLNIIGMSYAPKFGEIVTKTENGADLLPEMSTREKELEFVDKIESNSAEQPDPNIPDQDLKIWFPFSSVGLKIAIRFTI